MSYCRFSSDDWKSDVYIYEDNDGYALHVAHNRIVDKIPEVGPYPFTGSRDEQDAWFVAHEKQLAAAAGYHVPQSALDKIEGELEAGGFLDHDEP